MLDDVDILIEICNSGFEYVTKYKLFIRFISEQTIMDNRQRRLMNKEAGCNNATALHNLTDPEVTFYKKRNKENGNLLHI